MSARLILDPGKPGERVFPLAPGESTVGRTSDNAVYVLHKSLSRRHARFVVSDGEVVLEDLHSKNGTFVDGVRVSRHPLGRAHYITCGDVVFSFVRDEADAFAPTLIAKTESLRPPPSLRAGESALGLRAEAPAERAREKLELLLRASRLLSAPMDLDALLARVLELLFSLLDVDRGVVLVPPGEGDAPPAADALEARAARSRGGTPPGAFYSRQIVAWVLARGEAALFADAPRDARVGQASIAAQSIQGAMCAPLLGAGRVHGVIYVDNLARPNRFGQEDLDFLSAFASQAALAIDNALLAKKLEREAVQKSHLERFFPRAVVEAILARRADPFEPVETEATLLFCDISGFTKLASRMRPRELIALLNGYFPTLSEVVFRHEGTIEKYIGDALLAVWGAPVAHDDDPTRAVRAALEMRRAAERLGRERRVPLSVHIGIGTGPVAAGNVGSPEYLQFATVGDATNVASRICSVARPGQILVDERTRARLDPRLELDLEALPPISVKGKDEPLRLHRVRRDG